MKTAAIGHRIEAATPSTEVYIKTSAAARRPMARRSGISAWGLSVGLHLVLLGTLNYALNFEPPKAGIETGAPAPAPALVLTDSPEPVRPSASRPPEFAATVNPISPTTPLPRPVTPELPVLSAIPPATPLILTQSTLEETSREPVETTRETASPISSKAASSPTRRPASRNKGGEASTESKLAASGGYSARSGGEGVPSVLRNPPPEYPEAERLAGHEGTVILWVRIEADGTLSKVSIANTSGFARLDASALNTVSRRWRFKSARQFGTPIAAEFLLPIRFALKQHRVASTIPQIPVRGS